MSINNVLDPNFVSALKRDPYTTLRGIGVDPTEDVVNKVNSLDENALKTTLERFRSNISKTSNDPEPHVP